MFEDSLMESSGLIRTRSRWWSLAALLLNGSMLLILILIPLIYPEALPKQALATLLVAPPPPSSPSPPAAPVRVHTTTSKAIVASLAAPRLIPSKILNVEDDAPPSTTARAAGDMPAETAMGNLDGIFNGIGRAPAPVVKVVATPRKVAVSSGVAAGNLLNRISPVYPPIAKAARIQGTVVVQATISRAGTIENARAISGPEMLRQSAIEGVKSARYKPYLLNGEPVEVETTVNVIFSLGS